MTLKRLSGRPGTASLVSEWGESTVNPSHITHNTHTTLKAAQRSRKTIETNNFDTEEFFPNIHLLGEWKLHKHCKLLKPPVDMLKTYYIRKKVSQIKLRQVTVGNKEPFNSHALPSLYLNCVDVDTEESESESESGPNNFDRLVASYKILGDLKERIRVSLKQNNS
tara:strand:- start:412 stop:909 length:498 start_codon:yes stop_codon:yes gene_type:complete